MEILRPEHSFRRIIQSLDKIFINNKNFDMKDTIIVVGSPRSGTTLLMEILGVIPGYKSLFEPLNPLYYPETIKVGFQSRTYRPPTLDWGEGEEYLKKIFTGNVIYDSSWLEKGDYTKDIFSEIIASYLDQLKPDKLIHQLMGNKLLIKFVWLNRLLPWVSERFQLRSMIFIIRHPCGYVASRIKPGYKPPDGLPANIKPFPTPEEIFNEASKIEGLDTSLLNRLKKIKTLDEILAVRNNTTRLSLIGPSGSGLPDILFKHGVDAVGGIKFHDNKALLDALDKQEKWGHAGEKYQLTTVNYPGVSQLLKLIREPAWQA